MISYHFRKSWLWRNHTPDLLPKKSIHRSIRFYLWLLLDPSNFSLFSWSISPFASFEDVEIFLRHFLYWLLSISWQLWHQEKVVRNFLWLLQFLWQVCSECLERGSLNWIDNYCSRKVLFLNQWTQYHPQFRTNCSLTWAFKHVHSEELLLQKKNHFNLNVRRHSLLFSEFHR